MPRIEFLHGMKCILAVIYTQLSLLALASACSEDVPCTEHRIVIPRTCRPGTLLLSLEYVGQSFQISTAVRHFAVLANGDVICTVAAAASGTPSVGTVPGVDGTVSFGVECRLGLLAWTELIHVTMANDRDLLVSFAQPYFEGHVVAEKVTWSRTPSPTP